MRITPVNSFKVQPSFTKLVIAQSGYEQHFSDCCKNIDEVELFQKKLSQINSLSRGDVVTISISHNISDSEEETPYYLVADIKSKHKDIRVPRRKMEYNAAQDGLNGRVIAFLNSIINMYSPTKVKMDSVIDKYSNKRPWDYLNAPKYSRFK